LVIGALSRLHVSVALFLFSVRAGPPRPPGGGASLPPKFVLARPAPPATIGAPTIEQETRAEEELDLPWQVVVHNDPVNLMSYVTMVFQRVFGYPRDKAERHMLEVHHKGHSILWSGLREPAELYVQQLHGYL